MKVSLVLACTCVFLVKKSAAAAIHAPLDIISLDDLSEADRHNLEYLENHFDRPKRHKDILGSLKDTIGQGIKAKLGQIARGSAAASSHFSSGSSGHGYHHYDVPQTYDHKSFDFWSLKKSILNTLLQAVKAIKGGVLAVKGQLIKGSGYLISAKGKLISSKGEAITSLGKNIASSAALSPYPHHTGHSAAGHGDYGHFHHVSGPSEEYGSPSAPGPEYELPEHQHHPHLEDKPGSHSGILILKKIPPHHEHMEHHSEEHHLPAFKPIAPAGPGLGTVVGKFFSASTSLTPGEPAPFGDTAPGPSFHHQEAHVEQIAHNLHEHYANQQHDSSPYSNHEHHTAPEHHASPYGAQEHHSAPEHHSSPYGAQEHHSAPLHHSSSYGGHEHHSSPYSTHEHHVHEEPHSPPSGPSEEPHHQYLPTPAAYMASGPSHLKPPATSYGTPFEEAPDYLNFENYASESKFSHNAIRAVAPPIMGQKSTTETPPIQNMEASANIALEPTIISANFYQNPLMFIASDDQPGPPSDLKMEVVGDFGGFKSDGVQPGLKYLAQPPHSSGNNFPPGYRYNGGPEGKPNKIHWAMKNHGGQNNHKNVPPHKGGNPNGRFTYHSFPPYPPNHFSKNLHDGGKSHPQKPPQHPPRGKPVAQQSPPGIDVVRSIAFELTPNGPKML